MLYYYLQIKYIVAETQWTGVIFLEANNKKKGLSKQIQFKSYCVHEVKWKLEKSLKTNFSQGWVAEYN